MSWPQVRARQLGSCVDGRQRSSCRIVVTMQGGKVAPLRIHTGCGVMWIRRWIDIIRQLVTELGLVFSVTLVCSTENLADALTSFLEEWMRSERQAVGAAAMGERDTDITSNADVHVCGGHPGIRYMLFFAQRETFQL